MESILMFIKLFEVIFSEEFPCNQVTGILLVIENVNNSNQLALFDELGDQLINLIFISLFKQIVYLLALFSKGFRFIIL